VVVLHTTSALPAFVQPQNSDSNKAANRLRRADRMVHRRDLAKAVAAACVPAAWLARPKNVNSIDLL
jgi:hypothetical protein